MTTREALYRLIDELPEDALSAVEEYLVTVREDPVLRAALLASVDDETSDHDEDAAAVEAWQAYLRGEYVTDAGLTERLERPGA